MPLYSDSNYYYSGGSSQLYSPYYSPGLYNTPTSTTSSGSYAPYTSTYNRAMGGSYTVPLTPARSPTYTTSSHALSSRYQPKLSTITETLPLMGTPRHTSLMPLTRMQSPKFNTYTPPSSSTTTPYIPKYIPPRPILINTADIDVSSNSRFRKHHEEEEEEASKREAAKKAKAEKTTISPKSSLKRTAEVRTSTDGSDLSSNEQSEQPSEHKGARSTIKRDRAVVRLSTIRSRSKDHSVKSSTAEGFTQEQAGNRFRDLPQLNDTPEVKVSWRQKLADDLAAIPTYPLKKSPGDKIRERYLILDEKADDSVPIVTRPPRGNAESIEEVIVEIDPLHHTIRRLSIPQCPTFHEICEDISSDKIDDDLNAGELRRRASLIQEQEQELFNQLQKSPSGTYQLINLERQGSHDSVHDETSRKSKTKRKSKRGSKKIRHKITAIVGVENAALTPVILETEEFPSAQISPKPRFTANVEAVEEHHEIHKIFKLPKKKSIKRTAKTVQDLVLPEGFVQSVPKAKMSLTTKSAAKPESFISTAEIFTFELTKEQPDTEELVEDIEMGLATKIVRGPLVSTEILNAIPETKKLLDTLVENPVSTTEISTTILQPEILWDSPKSTKQINTPETDKGIESPKVPKKTISSDREKNVASPKTPKVAKSLKEAGVPESPTSVQNVTAPTITKAVEEKSKLIQPTVIKDKAKTSATPNLKSSISIDVTTKAKIPTHPLEKSQSLNIDVGALAKPSTVKAGVLSQEDVSKLTPSKTMSKPLIQSDPNISDSYQKPSTQMSQEVEFATVASACIGSSKPSSESGEDFWAHLSSSESLDAKLAATKDTPINTTTLIDSSKPSSESGEDKNLWSQFSSSESLDTKLAASKVKLKPKEEKPIQPTTSISSSKPSSESGEDFWSHLGSSENLDLKPATTKNTKSKPKEENLPQKTTSISCSKPCAESRENENLCSQFSSSESLDTSLAATKAKPKLIEAKCIKKTTSLSSSKPSSESGEDFWSHLDTSENLDLDPVAIKATKLKSKEETAIHTTTAIDCSEPCSETREDKNLCSQFSTNESLDASPAATRDKPKPIEEKRIKTTKSMSSSKPSSESGEDFWSHLNSSENLDAKTMAIKDKPKEEKPIQTTTSIDSLKPSSESGEDLGSQSNENLDVRLTAIKDTKSKPKEEKPLQIKTTKPTVAKTAAPKESGDVSKPVIATKQLEKSQCLNTEEAQPSIATPKPIRKFIEKSDSAEDFWSKIGSRETLYMTNRKKILMDEQSKKHEDLLEKETEETENVLETVTQKKISALKTEIKNAVHEPKLPTELTLTEKVKTEPKITEISQNETVKKPDPITQKKNILSPTKLSPKKDLAKLQTATKLKELKTKTTPPLAKPTTTSIVATTTTTTATAPTMPKINAGQTAKSPEQQQNKFATTAPETVTVTTTTKTTPAAKIAPTAIVKAANNDAAQALINNTTAIKTTKTFAVGEKAKDSTSNETIQIAATTIKTQPETKSTKIAETIKKPSPKKIVTPTTTNTTPITTTTTTTSDKTNVPTIKPKTATNIGGKVKSSPTTKTSPSNVVATAINADNFISLAKPKAASPINDKPKIATAANASSTAKNAATTQQQQQQQKPPAMPAAITIASTPATKTTTTTTTATTTTKTTATDAKTIQTATTAATAAVAQPTKYPDSSNDVDNNTRSGNNLSKFATVSNLAQYLQDVDADLEDYVPSSAENSDNDDDDDNSSSNYSSIDGRDNLSASMKKKLKQRRKKEKAAAKARFDPQKKIKIDTGHKCYVSDEPPRFPLVATPRPLWKREKIVYPPESEDESDSDEEDGSAEETDDSEECSTTSEEFDDELNASTTASSACTAATNNVKDSNSAIIRMSTSSNDSGFEGGTAPSSPKKMLECDVNCHKKCERLTANMCGVNQKLIVEALASVRRGAQEARESPSTPPSTNPAYRIEAHEEHDETSYTYSQFQKSGRFTAPATVIPRFKTYSVDDFHFLAVLGKGSFGKVLLAELRNTEYYYAVKCLKKDVVLEDDDVDSTLIERKVLALGTKHPYLCHLFCTFQTESHLFFVMEYLNGGDLMFHIQESGRFPEDRARFYGAEIISGLKFLHKKGIIYRDLKLDNVLLDFDGHVRIADFGMCKLQIYLDKTADSFCGTPDYMAPEIIKGEKYNQNVDWWSFGVLLYEMLIGQSPFSGCDEDELFWSICNEIPWFPVYISAEATSILKGLLEKDYAKRIGSQYSLAGDIAEHIFFNSIDWNLLDKRQLQPPFKPQVKHPLDTQYFDRVFTRERVRLTPIDKDILHSMDQKQFHGFSYTNPHITLD